MITIVGIKHTEALEKQLESLIFKVKPDVICVELDRFRYKVRRGEVSEEEMGLYKKNLPPIYKTVSLFKYRSQVESGVKRDWDVDVVLRISEEIGAEVVPIDMDQDLVYKRIEENISFREKIELMLGLFRRMDFYGEQEEKSYEKEFSKKFPTLMRYLMDERTEFMAGEVRNLSRKYERVLVVVGNAHLEGMAKLLKDINVKLVDVDSLREFR
ncbi:MAG TPA: hypothetical protein ENI14_02595 [Thermoplasmatales archaeon]|nr:hypothetical protein [Thermoplasmatales archaeon]